MYVCTWGEGGGGGERERGGGGGSIPSPMHSTLHVNCLNSPNSVKAMECIVSKLYNLITCSHYVALQAEGIF